MKDAIGFILVIVGALFFLALVGLKVDKAWYALPLAIVIIGGVCQFFANNAKSTMSTPLASSRSAQSGPEQSSYSHCVAITPRSSKSTLQSPLRSPTGHVRPTEPMQTTAKDKLKDKTFTDLSIFCLLPHNDLCCRRRPVFSTPGLAIAASHRLSKAVTTTTKYLNKMPF